MTTLAYLNEKKTIVDYVYNSYNTEDELGILPKQLHEIFREVRNMTLNLPQIIAAVDYVCACPPICDKEELIDVLKEMDRRYEIDLLMFNRIETVTENNTKSKCIP